MSARKETIHNALKGFTQTSIFDQDLSSATDMEEVKPISFKQFFQHAIGKERLSNQDRERMKKQAKYSRFL
ncbi:hypothetical protein [Brevibacillus migulae]|uniref:hypothetical protein n=1 Tax=Brevibacillus migulae TaxID=1644114 RepID=UPI00106E2F77|nr:hypothetical protein [Brevibacillus migulae]